MLRVLLALTLGYFLFRIVQLTMRTMSNRGQRQGEEDPFASSPPATPPAKEFKDIRDADFEDITPKDTDGKPDPPKSS